MAKIPDSGVEVADQIIADSKPRVQKEEAPGRYDDIRKRGGSVTARGKETLAKLQRRHGGAV